jgi:RHS repeat-associated protein
MADPETGQPTTSPDQNGNPYGVTSAFEAEMKSWDQSQLEAFWKDTVNVLVTKGADVVPYVSPSGDTDFEKRVNQITQDYVAALQADPSQATAEAYSLKRADGTTTSSGPNVKQGLDPVNLFNGDFVYTATDFRIDGAGMDFTFTRTYSQLCAYRGPLGFNWDHLYNLWIRVPGDGTVLQCSTGALNEKTFQKHEQYDYWFPLDGGGGVILGEGGSFVYRLLDGVRVFYQPHPTLHPSIHVVALIEDRFGNYLRFSYNDGRLVRVEINNPERLVDFEYDTEDRITAARDFSGRTWRYLYDDLGDLIAVTTPATDQYGEGVTTNYEYSSALNSDPNLQHQLISIIDGDGRLYLDNDYGTEPNLVSYRRVTQQRQGSGDVVLEYADVIEEFEHPYEEHERPTHQTIVTERDGRQVRYLFNRLGHMLFREEYARLEGVPQLVSWHYRYNRDGNLVGILSPLGVMTQLLYGRDMYEQRFPPDHDYRPENDPNLTLEARLQFDNLLAVVKRGRYHDVGTPDLGLWSTHLFPDILDTDAEDVVQKFSYEPEFTQTLTVSDPRATRSADPTFPEDAEYQRRLTKFSYSAGQGFQHLLLESIELPTPVLPDGTLSAPVTTRFPEYDGRGRRLRVVAPNGLETLNAYAGTADGVLEGFLKTTTLDPNGFAITTGVERDVLARAVRVFRPPFFEVSDGRYATAFEYNALGQILRSIGTAPFSVTTRNRYQRAGTLSRLEVDLKDETNALVGSVVIVDRYDEELHLVAQSMSDGTGQLIKRTIIVLDQAARPCLVIGPSGRKLRAFFNERSLIAKTIDDYGGVHAVTRRFYDADGRLVRVVDPRGATTNLAYDALGRLIDTEDARGNRIIRSFDKLGNMLVECRYEKATADQFRLLARREFTYDELGRLIVASANRFEQPPSVSTNQLHAAFQSSGPGELATIQSFYDNVGNLIKQVDQEGRAFVSEYDLVGRVTRKVDPMGNELRFRYDKEGNTLRVDRQDVTRDPVTNVVTATRCFAEAFAYDELNRLTERRSMAGVLRYRYDSLGNPVELEDPLGDKSHNRYDIFSRLVENRQLFHRHQPGDVPVDVTTSFTYDRDDLKTSQTDSLGRVTRFRYDSAGRLVSVALPDGSADFSTYDRAGNLIGYCDRNGLARLIEWDEVNRPIALRVDATQLVPGAEFAGATAYRAEYDGLGRFVLVENDDVVNRYSYDSLDHPLREMTSFTAATGVDPSRQLVVARAFSNSGALTALIYPSGRELHYGRDPLNRVVEIRQVSKGNSYPGDPMTPDNLTIASIAYEGLQISSVDRHNGTSTAFKYDFAGRTVELSHGRGPESVLTAQLLHDAAGHLRQRTEVAQDFLSTGIFRYDSLSRLSGTNESDTASLIDLSSISPPAAPPADPLPDRQPEIDALLSTPGGPHNGIYDYDLVGNRISRTFDGTAESYETNELDQYRRVGGAALRYDLNGNLAEDEVFRYTYDHRNQLTRIVRKADGRRIDLARDYFGKSCLEREDGQLRITVYDGHDALEQYEGAQLKRSVIFDAAQHGPLIVASGGRDLYLLSDLTGSVRYLLDRTGPRKFYVYDEFGNLRSGLTAGDDNVFRFAGQRLLADTGKYDFVFRVYDPSRGRFFQRDPKGYIDGSNLYVYAKNNPFAFRDPDGLESRPEQAQAIDAGLHTARAASTPLDRAGRPLKGTYNLWSGQTGHAQAQQAPGWIMEQTPEHAQAEALERDFYAKNPGQQMPRDVFEDIWVGRSKTVARKAVLSGKPVASWGLDTHANPSKTVQFEHEVPTVRSWGGVSALGMKFGGLLNIWAATQVDNPYIKGVGLTAGVVETFGGTLYFGGALTQETSMMALGGNFVRFGGGVGLTVVSGYTFINDVSRGNVRDAIGSGANTASGITMLVTSNPWALTATGTFAVSYNASRWVAKETGWGQASGRAGATVANFIMGDDPGVVREGVGYAGGFIVTAGGVLVVEPVAFAGKKIGQGASWAYDKITDAIGYELYWPF